MPVRLYALLTWTTLRRLPLIHCGAAEFLRRMLPTIARRHATTILGIGIVRNHVHLVLDLPPLVDVHAWFRFSRARVRESRIGMA